MTATGEVAPRAPVMTDVAKIAGVSHQTVSRVLNGHPSVRPSTRDRVLAAIAELDYRRNSAARALVTRRSRTLGVVSFDTTLYGPASTLLGIEQAARAAGYFISITSLQSIDRGSVGEALDGLRSQSVDGIVVIAPQRSAAEALLDIPDTVPVVSVAGGPASGFPVVTVDQVHGAAAATRHLLDLGHHAVWHVAGPAGWLEAEGRIAGWRAESTAAGAAVPDLVVGDWSPRSGYVAGLDLARRAGVTAVFVANDQMALGLLRAFHERGVRVPEDVSIVGFDDIPEADYFTPRLTTVRQDFTEVGRSAVDLLVARLEEGRSAARRVVVPAELVVRESTAAPPP